MSKKKQPRLHFPVAILLRDGTAIVDATEADAAVRARLPDGCVAPARALLLKVEADVAGQKSKAGDVGEMTLAQEAKFAQLNIWIAKARKTARKAFKGQTVKLHEEFQVGVNKPMDLPSVRTRAGIIIASLQKPANQPALKLKGWLEADTEAFSELHQDLGGTDETQESSKGTAQGATSLVQTDALALNDQVMAMQNAADLQYPAENPANIENRVKFRIGTFPPKSGGSDDEEPTPPTPPPPPA